MVEEIKKTSPVVAELKRLKEKLNSLELEKKAKPEIKEKIEKKIEETEEKIEEVKKRKTKSGFIKYWQDVKAGKKKTPWEIHKERLAKQEKEIKPNPEEKTPEKEAEPIKEKVEKVTEADILQTEQPKEEPKEEKPEEKPKEGFNISKFLKGFYEKNDIWVWLIGLGFLIWAGMKFLSGRNSPKVPAKEETEQPSKPGTRKVDIGSPGHPHIVDWPIQ
jgi:hypothetical protein